MIRFATLILVIGTLALAACGGGSTSATGLPGDGGALPGPGENPAPTSGTLRIHITDAPFPYEYVLEASVVIEEVNVREKTGEGWTTVFTRDPDDPNSGKINLVEYSGGITYLLTEATIEPGTYDEVRMIVDAGRVLLDDAPGRAVIEDGNPEFTTANEKLKFPSGAQTGIKVKIDNDIVVTSELSGELILDFDLTKNFVFNGPMTHAPGVKRVLFTPVVRATNESLNGTYEVEVLSDTDWDGEGDEAISGANVYVFTDGEDTSDTSKALTSGPTGDDGVAAFGVPPGLYRATAEATGHSPGETAEATEVFLANVSRATIVIPVTGEIIGNVMSNAGTTDTTDDDWSIEGVMVEVRNAADDVEPIATAKTDSNGAFQVTGLTEGAYHLSFSATGFEDAAVADVDAAVSPTTGETVLLTPKTQTLTGTVSADTLPTSMTVSVAYKDVSTIADPADVEVTVDATDGSFSFSLPTGSYTLTFDDGDDTTTNPTKDVVVEGGAADQDIGTITFAAAS